MSAIPANEIETLWNDYHSKLLAYMRRRVEPSEAEDYVQEVFERALSAMQRGLGYTEHTGSWLFRIAHNLIIDRYRHNSRLAFEDIEGAQCTKTGAPLLEVLATDDMPLDDAMVQFELNAEVHRALTTLTADQQTVLVLRMAEYTYEEIDEVIGTDKNARALAYRGRQALKERLAEVVTGHPLTNKRPALPVRIRELLAHDGPMGAYQIGKKLGLSHQYIYYVLKKHADTFAVVGKGSVILWGIVGTHKENA